MKRTRTMLILAGVLIVLCAVIALENALTLHYDSINTTDEIILTLDQETLTGVSWTYEEETLTFEAADGVWTDADDGDFPVNQEVMEEFLAHFEEVHACFIIEDVADYSQYGLEEPQCTVTLTAEDGETVVSLGGYSTMDAQRYISVGDGKVYLIEDDLLDYITTDRDDFMQHDELPAYDNLTELTVSGGVSLDVVYDPEGVYAYTDAYSYYLLSGGSYLLLDDDLVEDYLDTLASLDLTDYATYTASAEDLSDYGLDDPAYTITVTAQVEAEEDEEAEETQEETTQAAEETTEAAETDQEETPMKTVTYTVYIGVVELETETSDEDSDETEADEETEPELVTYLRVGDSEIIYNLSSSDYETLSGGSYDTLRPTQVLNADWETLTGLSFTLDGERYDVTVTTRGELAEAAEEDADETGETEETEDYDPEEIVYLLQGQEIDLDAVLDAADDLTINTFQQEQAGKTLEFALTVTLDREEYSSVTVQIYQYDGEDCLVFLDGSALGLMSRSLMVELREAATSIVLGLTE